MTFANKISSSTSCSIWLPENLAAQFLSGASSVAASKLQHFRSRRISLAYHGAHCARVRGRHEFDAGCVSARDGILRKVLRLPSVTPALSVRLGALQGWVLEALRALGA